VNLLGRSQTIYQESHRRAGARASQCARRVNLLGGWPL